LREANEVEASAVEPPLVKMVSLTAVGARPLGTEVMRRVQFVPSAERPTEIPMRRGFPVPGGTVLAIWRPMSTAATPTSTTATTMTRTTIRTTTLLVERAGSGGHIIGPGVGAIGGWADADSGTPQFEQN
jgi:hypothetical protein